MLSVGNTARVDAQASAFRVINELRQTLENRTLSASDKVERIHALTDEMETLTRAYLAPGIPEETWKPYCLTTTEARIAALLYSKIGSAVRTATIMDALYFDRNPDEWPEDKLVQVVVCKMRKKLTLHNAPYRIETVWGLGVKMVRTDRGGITAGPPFDELNILDCRH